MLKVLLLNILLHSLACMRGLSLIKFSAATLSLLSDFSLEDGGGCSARVVSTDEDDVEDMGS